AAAPARGANRALRFTVVLVGGAAGRQPRSMDELRRDGGVFVRHLIDPRLTANNDVLEQSLYLFSEYIAAITDGRLTVEHHIVRLPALDAPVTTAVTELKVAGRDHQLLHADLGRGALPAIWGALDESVLAETDWWWVIYPSHVPEQYPDFAATEFVTGGMTR